MAFALGGGPHSHDAPKRFTAFAKLTEDCQIVPKWADICATSIHRLHSQYWLEVYPIGATRLKKRQENTHLAKNQTIVGKVYGILVQVALIRLLQALQADSRGSRGPCLSGYAKRLDPGPSIGSWVKWPLIRVSQSSTLLFEMCGLPITINNLYIWGPKQRNYKHHNTPLRFPPIAFHMPSPLISMVCYNQQNQQMNVTWITCQRASSKPFDIDNGYQWKSMDLLVWLCANSSNAFVCQPAFEVSGVWYNLSKTPCSEHGIDLSNITLKQLDDSSKRLQ